MKQFVTFTLNEKLYGIEILYVRELNQVAEITPVEHAPEYIRGMINLRGQIVTIFDIGSRFGMESRECSDTTYNIILKTNSELAAVNQNEDRDDLYSSDDIAGFLVDSFGDVVEMDDDCMEPPPANVSVQEKVFMSGVVKNDDLLFIVLNVNRLLSTDEEMIQEVMASRQPAHSA